MKILLESAMGKLGAENLVLAEKQEESRRGNANDVQWFWEGRQRFCASGYVLYPEAGLIWIHHKPSLARGRTGFRPEHKSVQLRA